MLNGYGTQVVQPYRGMDLQRFLCVAGEKDVAQPLIFRAVLARLLAMRQPWERSALHAVRGRRQLDRGGGARRRGEGARRGCNKNGG